MPPSQRAIPMVECMGDADDHLRLTVLLADGLRAVGDPNAVARCMAASTPWRERLRAFEALLDGLKLPSERAYAACVVDPDALDLLPVGDATVWDDTTFRRERAEVLGVLQRAAERGGWVFVRPFPSTSFSEKLAFMAGGIVATEEVDSLDLPLSLGPVHRWLRAQGGLSSAALQRLVDDDNGGADGLFDALLDALPTAVLNAAVKVSAVRTALDANGHLGPFRWGPGESVDALPRAETERLQHAGFLVREAHAATWRVLRPARQRLQARLTRAQEATQRAVSTMLATPRTGSDPSAWIEAHHHAVRAGLVDDALATAVYYGSDLRELARAESLRGRHAEAARIYKIIVERFDALDAYAWEYLAYNLARVSDAPSRSTLDDIEAAYQMAHDLAGSNPLFHGRLLGFRVAHRAAPLAAAEPYCGYYRATTGPEGRDWFGWQVVTALRRAGRREEANGFQQRWSILPPAGRSQRVFGCGRGEIQMADDFDAPLEAFEALGP